MAQAAFKLATKDGELVGQFEQEAKRGSNQYPAHWRYVADEDREAGDHHIIRGYD